MKESLRERLGHYIEKKGEKLKGDSGVQEPSEPLHMRHLRESAEKRAKADAEKKNSLRRSSFFTAAKAINSYYDLSLALGIDVVAEKSDFFTERLAMNLVSEVQSIDRFEYKGRQTVITKERKAIWQKNYFLPYRTSDSTPGNVPIDSELDKISRDVLGIILRDPNYSFFRGIILYHIDGARASDLQDIKHLTEESPPPPLAQERIIREARQKLSAHIASTA